MEFLKEDGSLDLERINSLPIEEYMDVIGGLTQEQYLYYLSKLPINKGHGPIKPIVVDDTLAEEIERGSVIAKDYINNMRERLKKRIAEQENYKTKLI